MNYTERVNLAQDVFTKAQAFVNTRAFCTEYFGEVSLRYSVRQIMYSWRVHNLLDQLRFSLTEFAIGYIPGNLFTEALAGLDGVTTVGQIDTLMGFDLGVEWDELFERRIQTTKNIVEELSGINVDYYGAIFNLSKSIMPCPHDAHYGRAQAHP